jgi:hypothetical protein
MLHEQGRRKNINSGYLRSEQLLQYEIHFANMWLRLCNLLLQNNDGDVYYPEHIVAV